MSYQDLASQIIEKIRDKGWNVYNYSRDPRLHCLIVPGPVSILDMDKKYWLFPQVKHPRDPAEVRDALLKIQRELKYQEVPGIFINGNGKIKIRILQLRKRNVTIHSRRTVEYISYRGLLERLDTLTDITSKLDGLAEFPIRQ